MMDFLELLKCCRERAIRFTLSDGQLKMNAPNNTLTPELVEQLRKWKPELIAWIEASRITGDGAPAPIAPVPRSALLPVSPGQQQLWLAQNMEAMGDAYHFVTLLDLEGGLDVDALRASFGAIVERHEALRTVFYTQDGALYQRIIDGSGAAMGYTDLLGAADGQARAQALQQALACAPFDLGADCMLRLHLLRLDEDQHRLILVLHHIASDGWSLGVLAAELQMLYTQLCAGNAPHLPPLPVQYADYAHSLPRAGSDTLAPSLAYWGTHLAGVAECHQLPMDFPRPAQQSFKGAHYMAQLDAATLHGLKQLAQASGATLFMVLECVFAVLLARYSQCQDVVLGTPVANRPHADTAGLIGYFVNMLVLRHALDQSLSFSQLLAQTKQQVVQAYDHAHMPFDAVVRTAVKTRNPGFSPLVQITFALQNNAIPDLALPELRCTIRQQPKVNCLFDLQLEATETAAGLALHWEYASDLFAEATVASLSRHFDQLLRAVLAYPERPLDQLDMLSDAERDQQLVTWNSTRAFDSTQCIHQMFEAQAERHPQAVAVVCEGQSLSYAALNAAANRLAHYLAGKHGVGPDTLVGLCVERSLDMMIGMLAILKAGGAYVPLDPDYPAARLAYMLGDAQLATVISHSRVAARLPAGRAQLLMLDDPALQAALAASPAGNIDAAAIGLSAQNLAYVIYTSGSTGQPKGALLEHRNVARLFTATDDCFGFGPQDTWTMFHSYGFDFSVWEIWGALCYGGKLVIVPHAVSRSPDLFHALLVEQQVTVLNQTPSAFQQLIAYDALAGAPARLALRYVIFGGEALNTAALTPWFARHGDAKPQLVNMYGITETTVHVTYQPLRAGARAACVGRPIPDLGLYILDGARKLVPVGVAGELYVSGPGLARGYLNRPELTAERFVANPYSQDPQARLYKSGDLGRYLADGSIEYLGRIDSQVKIRGFRIELGEIEAALSALPAVEEAAVLVREDVAGDPRLVAYLVLVDGASPDEARLRQALLSGLPDYMVPAHFVGMARLPLTANGKLDRKALPKPALSQSQASYVAPSTPTEAALCQMWQDVLGNERIGVHDDFFQLGGHSLLLMRVLSAVRAHFGVDVSAKTLFSQPTIEALGAYIDGLILNQQNSHSNSIELIEEGTF
jgi:amino acid adenylation domain-containing protein